LKLIRTQQQAGIKLTQQILSLTATIDFMDRKEDLKINFETAVTEAIDEVLTTLGENVKRVVYIFLENNYGIKKEQIPRKIEGFSAALESIFGYAAKLVEIKIMEKLQGKIKGFKYKSNCNEIFFTEYLARLQSYLD
jgi:hypothetical protein